jgi:hypothetical protein
MPPVRNDVDAVRAAVVLRPPDFGIIGIRQKIDAGQHTTQTTTKTVAAARVWTRPIAAYQMSEVIL